MEQEEKEEVSFRERLSHYRKITKFFLLYHMPSSTLSRRAFIIIFLPSIILGILFLFPLNKPVAGSFILAIVYSVAYQISVFPAFGRYLKMVKESGLDYLLPWLILIIFGIVSPIVFFGVFYGILAQVDSLQSTFHWMYFSSITFAGLGLGKLPFPNSELAKLAIIFESLLGYLYFGIIIVYTTKLVGMVSSPKEETEEKETSKVEKDLSTQHPKRKP